MSFFDAQALNSLGDSWLMDLHYMWTTLVVGLSLGFLWVCLVVNRLPWGISPFWSCGSLSYPLVLGVSFLGISEPFVSPTCPAVGVWP